MAKIAKKKPDDPLKQYVILDPKTMKTPPGRFLFIPLDTDDPANRMCWAIALASYADALKVFGRDKQAFAVVALAAEMANDTKAKHPELFKKPEVKNAKGQKPGRDSPKVGKVRRDGGDGQKHSRH